MRYQNFKSDFTSVHSFHVTDGGEQKQIPVPDHVRLTFFTEERRGRITVERNGDVTDGCSVSDDGMSLTAQVPLSRTFLGAGELFCEVEEIKSDPSFPQSERTEVTPTRPGITLWPGKTDDGADLITETVLSLVVPGVVRFDTAQTLSEEERLQARSNIEAAKELPVITYGDPKDKVDAVLADFYAGKIRSFVLETTNGAVCSVNVSRNYLFRATHLVKVSGADCFTLYIMVYQNGVWGTQTFENVTPYGVSYDGQTLTEGRKLQARKNIDAATKAITVPYDDIAAANAAVTAYKDDPRRTLVLVNYKSILAPAFVGITDKPFISAFISEAKQIRKLLFQNGAWTESLMYVPITSGMIADLAVSTPKLANYAVTATKLANSSVSTPKLANGAVTLPKLAESVLNEFARTATVVAYGSDPKTVLDSFFKGTPKPALYVQLSNGLLVPANTNGVTAAGLYSYGNSVRKVLFDGTKWSDIEIQSDTIDTAHLQDKAVTEAKLEEALQAKVNGNVRSVVQTLSDEEKAQARTNIGAQAELVSGTHIKTVNGKSLVGSGNVTVSGDGGGVVLLDFSESDTISLTEEQIADISDDSVTVIAVYRADRQRCIGKSASGAYLYFPDYTVQVNPDAMTASIEKVLHNSIERSASALTFVTGENVSIDKSYLTDILCTKDTVTIASMPMGYCVFHINVTGSAVLPKPSGFRYVFIGMDTPSDMTDGVVLGAGCYKVICRMEKIGVQKASACYYIFKL